MKKVEHTLKKKYIRRQTCGPVVETRKQTAQARFKSAEQYAREAQREAGERLPQGCMIFEVYKDLFSQI